MTKFFRWLSSQEETQNRPQHTRILGPEDLILRYGASSARAVSEKLLIGDNLKQALFFDVMYNFAMRCQGLPGSVSHHHAYHGGLLEHTLEVANNALNLYHERMSSSDENAVAQNYAVFIGALLHDFAKTVFRFNLETYDKHGNYIKTLTGLSTDSDYKQAVTYKLKVIDMPYIDQSSTNTLGFCLLPFIATDLLATCSHSLSELTHYLSGRKESYGVIGTIIHDADIASVKNNVGSWSTNVEPLLATLNPLRQAIGDKLVSWNSERSQAWRCGNRYFIQPGSAYAIVGGNELLNFPAMLTLWQENSIIKSFNGGAVIEVGIKLPEGFVIKRKVIELNPNHIGPAILKYVEDKCQLIDMPSVKAQEKETQDVAVSVESSHEKALSELLRTGDSETGKRFMAWLKQSVLDGSLKYNSAGACLHTVGDYALLVSPRIFKEFLTQHSCDQKDYEAVQNSFQKLGLYIKAVVPGDSTVRSFHSVRIINTKSKLRGYLLPIKEVFGEKAVKSNPILDLQTKLYRSKK